MERIVPLYQRFGIWIYFAGSLVFYVATSFPDTVWGWAFLILGALAALSDPAMLLLAKAQQKLESIERGFWIAWGLALAALVFFLIRYFIEVPVSQLAAGEEAFLPRLRLALLFLFLISYGASVIYRFMLSMSFSVQADAGGARLRDKKQNFLKTSAFSIFAFVPILILLNFVSAVRNPALDLSPGYFSFGEESRTIIGSIEEKVEITAFLPEQQMVQQRSDRVRTPELYRIVEELRVMLEQLPLINSNIELVFKNADLEAFNTEEFGTVSNGTIVFRVTRKDFVSAGDKPYVERRVHVLSEKDMSKLEREATEALIYVSSPRRKIYFTNANGERYGLTQDISQAASIESLKEQLRFFNSSVDHFDTRNGWPGPVKDDTSVLFIVGPTVPFGDEARQAIFDYVQRGGKLFITIDPEGREDFKWLRDAMGGKPYEYRNRPLTNTTVPNVAVMRNFGDHPILKDINRGIQALVVYPNGGYFESVLRSPDAAKAEEESPLQDLTPKEVLNTPYDAYHDANRNRRRDASEAMPRHAAALAYENPAAAAANEEGPRVLIFSGTDWIAERGLRAYEVRHKNLVLASQAFFWLTESPLVAGIVPKERLQRTTEVTDESKFRLITVGIFIFPLVVSLSLALSIYLYRRNRKFVGAG